MSGIWNSSRKRFLSSYRTKSQRIVLWKLLFVDNSWRDGIERKGSRFGRIELEDLPPRYLEIVIRRRITISYEGNGHLNRWSHIELERRDVQNASASAISWQKWVKRTLIWNSVQRIGNLVRASSRSDNITYQHGKGYRREIREFTSRSCPSKSKTGRIERQIDCSKNALQMKLKY